MAPDDVEICCFSCDACTGTCKNEWVPWSLSHIAPVQKPWYTATRISEERSTWQHKSHVLRLTQITVSEARCTNCGEKLGQYCRSARGADGELMKEHVFYDITAIYLRDSKSKEEVDAVMRGQPLTAVPNTSGPATLECGPEVLLRADQPFMRPTSQSSQQQCLGTQHVHDVPSRLARQDMHIIRLSKSLDLLQDRMLALEKSMVEIRTDLRAKSRNGFENEEPVLAGQFDAMLGAIEDAETAKRTADELRAENERLKQQLSSIDASTTKKVDVEDPATAHWRVATIASAGALEPAQKKRKCAKRKPAAREKAAISAVSAPDGPESGSVPPHELDEASQIGGLVALHQITAAMSQTHSLSPGRVLNQPPYHQFDTQAGEDLSWDKSGVDQGFPNVIETMATEAIEHCTSEHMTKDGDSLRTHAPKTIATKAESSTLLSSLLNQPEEEPRITTQQSLVPRTESQQFVATQAQNAPEPFQIAITDNIVDPALRSTSFPAIRDTSPSRVLSSIENPPGPARNPPAVLQDDGGKPLYDSIHESRIRDHKARDALRKRQDRARKVQKKQMDGDKEFKQEEKIRARDRMVRELMEREEMLESEGDL